MLFQAMLKKIQDHANTVVASLYMPFDCPNYTRNYRIRPN